MLTQWVVSELLFAIEMMKKKFLCYRSGVISQVMFLETKAPNTAFNLSPHFDSNIRLVPSGIKSSQTGGEFET